MAIRITKSREDLPQWVRDNIMGTCQYCGSFVLDNDILTARWCANPQCPGHMAYKIVEMAKFFEIKGIGPANARKMVRDLQFKSQFEVVPIWFDKQKPFASLVDIALMACIDGYGQAAANNELSQYGTFEQYFATAQPNPLLLPYKNLLIDAQKYFTLKKPLAAQKIYVMGTGSFHGFTSRDEYFRLINNKFGDYIHVIQTGRRKTGISYLIKERDTADHSKSAIAQQYNIPVVTPGEFISILRSMFNISLDELAQK